MEPHAWIFNAQKIWDIWKIPAEPAWKRAVLGMTFDGVYIESQHFQQAANDIRRFLLNYPRNPEWVNHWPALADLLEEWAKDPTIKAIGFLQTSCGESVYEGVYDEDTDSHTYEWDKTWSLYTHLKKEEP